MHNIKFLQRIHQFDLLAFSWCMQLKIRQPLTAFSHVISKTADGYLYPLFAIALWWFEFPGALQIIAVMLFAYAVERSIYFVVKRHFKRNRPGDAIDGFTMFVKPSDQFSFPSGHTSAAFMFAVFIGFLFPAIALPIFLWAFSIGLSRVFLGVHFPTDCVAGMCIGTAIATLSILTLLV